MFLSTLSIKHTEYTLPVKDIPSHIQCSSLSKYFLNSFPFFFNHLSFIIIINFLLYNIVDFAIHSIVCILIFHISEMAFLTIF